MRINERGNQILRDEEADQQMGGGGGDRYTYDFKLCTQEKGWRQFDTSQDAWYFGVWVHLEKRLVFTYCEGDRILVSCQTKESFRDELDNACRFYGAPPPVFVVIGDDGRITEVFDTRPCIDDISKNKIEGRAT